MNRFVKNIIITAFAVLFANRADSKTHIVKLIADKFVPAKLEIKVGDTVTWLNTTGDYHTSTSGVNCTGNGIWDSGIIENGKQFTHVFKKKGSFPYFCMPHCRFGMTGIITVVDAIKSTGKKTSDINNPSKKNNKTGSLTKINGSDSLRPKGIKLIFVYRPDLPTKFPNRNRENG